MATKKTTKSTSKNTSKKTTTSKPKKEVKEVKKENELANDFVEEKKKNKVKEEKIETKEIKEEVKEKPKVKNHYFVHFFLVFLLLVSLGYFAINVLDSNNSVNDLVGDLLLTLFTVLFVTISISYHRKSKLTIFVGGLLLLCYFLFNLNNQVNLVSTPVSTVEDFQNKSLTEVIKWASKNNITVNQEYEFSDMIPEYNVISQDVKSGTNLNKVKEITVSVSEGPNPDKEIMVPSMVSWDDKRVIEFVKDNYLNNVTVDFIASDKAKDTVIEQNTSGNLKRSDELHLVFSFGEELGFSEVKLIDFTNKSKFEVEFYMKQHQLLYEFNDDFSKKIKRGFAMKQSIAAGEVVEVNGKVISVTISKGPKVKVPDFKKMSLEEITEWAIKNKVKLSFTDQYDESIKENKVISSNFEKDSIIEQGTVVKIVLSRGALTMPKFKSLLEFYEWANKYNIDYEEKHEFSSTVKAGEIIKFSYKTGASIKNNDTIIVTISDGDAETVPNVVGLSKSEAIRKLEKVGLNYSFVYEASSRSKNKVINQSISAGSEISKGTTITLTISTGEENYVEERKASNNNSSNTRPSGNSGGGNNNSGNNGGGSSTPTPPQPSCITDTIWIDQSFISNVPSTTCANVRSAYPKFKFSCNYVPNSGLANGLISNAASIDGSTRSSCETIVLNIVSN